MRAHAVLLLAALMTACGGDFDNDASNTNQLSDDSKPVHEEPPQTPVAFPGHWEEIAFEKPPLDGFDYEIVKLVSCGGRCYFYRANPKQLDLWLVDNTTTRRVVWEHGYDSIYLGEVKWFDDVPYLFVEWNYGPGKDARSFLYISGLSASLVKLADGSEFNQSSVNVHNLQIGGELHAFGSYDDQPGWPFARIRGATAEIVDRFVESRSDMCTYHVFGDRVWRCFENPEMRLGYLKIEVREQDEWKVVVADDRQEFASAQYGFWFTHNGQLYSASDKLIVATDLKWKRVELPGTEGRRPLPMPSRNPKCISFSDDERDEHPSSVLYEVAEGGFRPFTTSGFQDSGEPAVVEIGSTGRPDYVTISTDRRTWLYNLSDGSLKQLNDKAVQGFFMNGDQGLAWVDDGEMRVVPAPANLPETSSIYFVEFVAGSWYGAWSVGSRRGKDLRCFKLVKD